MRCTFSIAGFFGFGFAALIAHGVRPGPRLLNDTPEFVYVIFSAMLVANLAFFVIGMGGAKIFSRVTLVPTNTLELVEASASRPAASSCRTW